MKNYAKILCSVFAFATAALCVLAVPTQVKAVGYGGEGGGGGGGGGGSSGGGGSGSACTNNVTAPPGGFGADVNSGNTLTTPAGQVILTIRAGDAVRMAISNTPTFENASQEVYSANKVWNLADATRGTRTIYFRFYNVCGNPTPVVPVTFDYQPQTPVDQFPVTPTPSTEGQVLGEKVNIIDDLIARTNYGQRSEDVRALQNALIALGYMPSTFKTATNYFGPLTYAAVMRYVDSHDRSLDTLISQRTFGRSHLDVRRLQRQLKTGGFLAYNVRITNYYGPLTRAGVRAYLDSR